MPSAPHRSSWSAAQRFDVEDRTGSARLIVADELIDVPEVIAIDDQGGRSIVAESRGAPDMTDAPA